MNQKFLTVGMLLASLLSAQSAFAQGATQALRNTAQGLQDQVDNNQQPITAGPADAQEKTKPGKIDDNPPRDFVTTASGLKYRILRKSAGLKPTAQDKVEVNYKGWLNDKTIFDSSYRKGKTISFPLSQVIRGWTEGVQLVGVGGMIELSIPFELGYGARGTPGGPIPPNAQLHFIVELVAIQ